MRIETNYEPNVHAVPDLTTVRKSNPGPLYRFALELQRRRVSRTALSYALIMWLNVQIGDVVFPIAGFPEWTLQLIVVIGVMGLPLVIFLAWTFQITPHGIVVDDGPDEAVETAPKRVADMAINVALLFLGLALATFLVAEFAFAESHDSFATFAEETAITERHELTTAVTFSTASEDGSSALVNGVEAQVRHQLIQIANVTVITDLAPETNNAHSSHSSRVFLLSGTLYVGDEQIHVLVQLLDVGTNEYRGTWEFDVESEPLLKAQREIAERIGSEFRLLVDGAEPDDEQMETTLAGFPNQRPPVNEG